MNGSHECSKDEAFKEVSNKLEGVKGNLSDLTLKIALVADTTGELKEVSKEMSGCIRALTESSIRLQENVITREQFYGKIQEIQDKSNAAQQAMCDACNGRHEALESRLDTTDGKATTAAEVAKGHTWQLKWLWGILGSIIGGLILLGVGLILQHFMGRT
jgi:hypothetical protein